jgi:hypothetical protein
MEHVQRSVIEFLGPGWVEVEPGIYRPPTLAVVDDQVTVDVQSALAAAEA